MWLTFGGPVPLKPEGYRFKAVFTEAPLLVTEADVRIAGLNVGKVKKVSRAPERRRRWPRSSSSERYAPLAHERARDPAAQVAARADLRRAVARHDDARAAARGRDARRPSRSRSPSRSTSCSTLFDEDTRENLQGWLRELATAIDKGRGEDFNEALGNLPQFVASGADVLRVLDDEEPALRRLVRNTRRDARRAERAARASSAT